jgi:hypothetical protein
MDLRAALEPCEPILEIALRLAQRLEIRRRAVERPYAVSDLRRQRGVLRHNAADRVGLLGEARARERRHERGSRHEAADES